MSYIKRSPFGEAGNRATSTKATVGGTTAHDFKRRMEPPSSVISNANPRAPPVSSILAQKNGVGSRVRPRQQLEPPQQNASAADAPSNPNANNDANRARVYKAEAYEAKIRIASQEQRIESLKAELDEVKFFQMIENEGKSGGEKKSQDDAELIEALADECETMEKDLKVAQQRVVELENQLSMERSKPESNTTINGAQSSEDITELKRQSDRLLRELNNAKRDVTTGISIMKELDKSLREARAERDDARSQLTTLSGEMQHMNDDSERIAVIRELEVALKSTQNERDGTLLEISSLCEEVETLREYSSKCEYLEKSNNELREALATVQTESRRHNDQMKQVILDGQAREEKLKNDHNYLLERYEEQIKESREMEAALDELANRFDEQKKELTLKATAIKELEDLHASNIANLKDEHSLEIIQMRKNESVLSSLEARHFQDMKMKDEVLQSRESYWRTTTKTLREDLAVAQKKNKAFEAVESNYRSEIDNLRDSMKELNSTRSTDDMEGIPHDELISENTKLRAEKDVLLHKLQRGLEIHKKTTMELEAKSFEVHNLQSKAADAQAEPVKDYTSAVELSISRGEKIESLEKEVNKYQSQLAKALHKIKQIEVKNEIEKDSDTRMSRDPSPRKSPSRVGYKERMRQIEDEALRAYCSERMQTKG